MFPVLLSIGNFPVSSFGLFLAMGIFTGAFAVWRISRGYDLDAEKILDLVFLTVGFGFLFARISFVLSNLAIFDSFLKIFFLNRYPGLSFWGGFLGSLIALWWFSRKLKIPYLQAADFAMTGFFLGAFFAELGCLLGSCGVGITTGLFFGVDQVGEIGKRLPVQAFEAVIYLVIFLIFWKTVLKFYVQGSIFAKGIILVSLVKIGAVFFKSESQMLRIPGLNINLDLLFAGIALLLGFIFYYKVNKKTPKQDLASFLKLMTDTKRQKYLVTKLKKEWYNQKVNFWVKLGKGKKKLFKLLNIRSNPESF